MNMYSYKQIIFYDENNKIVLVIITCESGVNDLLHKNF